MDSRKLRRELWRAVIQWLEIEKQTQERLAAIRQELAELCSREQPKPEMLSVKLY